MPKRTARPVLRPGFGSSIRESRGMATISWAPGLRSPVEWDRSGQVFLDHARLLSLERRRTAFLYRSSDLLEVLGLKEAPEFRPQPCKGCFFTGQRLMSGGVDHAVDSRGGAAKAIEIFQGAAVDAGARSDKRPGCRIRASQAEHPMTGVDQFSDDGRTDKACSASHENTHVSFSRLRSGPARSRLVVLTRARWPCSTSDKGFGFNLQI